MLKMKQIFVEKNPNGSLTISTFGQKETYYGYNKKDALRLFKKKLKKVI